MDVSRRRSLKDRQGLVQWPGSGEISWRDAALDLARRRETNAELEARVVRVARAAGVSWNHLAGVLNLAPQTVQKRHQ